MLMSRKWLIVSFMRSMVSASSLTSSTGEETVIGLENSKWRIPSASAANLRKGLEMMRANSHVSRTVVDMASAMAISNLWIRE